jgi:hypothetical protein
MTSGRDKPQSWSEDLAEIQREVDRNGHNKDMLVPRRTLSR